MVLIAVLLIVVGVVILLVGRPEGNLTGALLVLAGIVVLALALGMNAHTTR
jgi:drug/metabolite transporter (DMT)-like permease